MQCPHCQSANPDDSRFCGHCGTEMPALEKITLYRTLTIVSKSDEPVIGELFAQRYVIIDELGSGGMGRVFKALDKEINEIVALKVLKTEISLDHQMIERFRNELKLSRRISHPNVCRLYDLNKQGATYFISMEFIAGENLSALIKKEERFTVARAITIARQICEGLAQAHSLGVVHRDLKPHNIMIDGKDNAHIMDFGVARSVRAEGLTETGVLIGTPGYMSLEQLEGRNPDCRADIYSLGVVLYEMLTARIPFEGTTPYQIAMKNKTEEPEDPKRLNPQIPEEVGRVILKCLEKDRAKRYQTADDVLADLRKIERSILTADDTAPFAAAKRGTLKKRLPLPLVLLILAVSGLGYVFYNQLLSPQRKSPVQKPSLQTLPVAAAPEAQPRQDGDLSIKSNPAGADIYLEDRLEGTTPFERRLKPGFYRLKIKKTPGYEDITETLEVKAGETSFRDYALVPLKLAKAKIDSTPRGAEIHVADKIVGQTPLEFRLDPGPYDVKIKKEPEYKEIADRWDIKKGEIFVRKYILNPAYILEIETVPESADIKIDSEYKGKSPLKIELSKPSCQLTIENGDQWTKIDEPVVLHSGRNPIRRSLLKVKHSLFIKTIPPGAGVSINGIPVGVSPVKKMDLSGDCEIKIEKEGYAFVSDTVKVESDTEKTYELSKIEPKPPEKEPASPARFGYMVLEFERAWFDFGLKPREQFAPTNLAADNSGQIFVTDRVNKSIRLFSTDGQYRKIWATQTLIDGLTVSPYGVAVDKSGSIYVTDVSYHRIVRFDAEGNVSETWRSYSKKEAYPLNLFKNPTGIAVDNSGRVYICDTGNNRILIINAKGEIVQNLGATGKSPAKFLRPTGIAVDNAGAIYVADQGNCRIQIFSSQGIFLREIGKRLGTTELKSPTGVAVDNMGYVYIVDSGNHKIYKINELGLLVAEQGSLGQEAAQFNSPQGIAVDALGYAYIADTNNRRIQKFKIR